MRLIILFTFISHLAFGQTTIAESEKLLVTLGKKTIMAKTEAERLACADSFANALDETIGNKTSFSYSFENIKNLSSLVSPDKNFRIYTWSVPMKDGSFSYFGRIVLKKDDKYKTIKLDNRGDSIDAPEFRQLKASDWYGAIYYDIVKTKTKKTTYYTLLGYRPNKGKHTEKILEVLSTDNFDIFRFGERIFNTHRVHGVKYPRKPYRLIFRYNPKITSTLRYQPEEDRIAFDHLSPPDASLNKQWQFYGPDFSFDALYWKKGKWHIEEGIEISNNIKPVTPPKTEKGLPQR